MATALSHKLLLDKSKGIARGVRRLTMKDVIADKIGALIASGVLTPGDELPSERELASALSVSRETVRSAIQALAAKDVLEVTHGTRTRVATADLADMEIGVTNRLDVDSYGVDDVHEARLLTEQKVVGDAAENMSDQTLHRLRLSFETQQECRHDPVRFLICDREFHVTIYRECNNPLLADIVTDLYTYMMEHRRRAVSVPGAIDNSISDHLEILESLQARDPAKAKAAFARHEERIYTTTRKLLEDIEPTIK